MDVDGLQLELDGDVDEPAGRDVLNPPPEEGEHNKPPQKTRHWGQTTHRLGGETPSVPGKGVPRSKSHPTSGDLASRGGWTLWKKQNHKRRSVCRHRREDGTFLPPKRHQKPARGFGEGTAAAPTPESGFSVAQPPRFHFLCRERILKPTGRVLQVRNSPRPRSGSADTDRRSLTPKILGRPGFWGRCR